MTYQYILYDKEDGVAIITMNRPKVLNAWIGQMKAEMMDALDDASADSNVLGVIFTGAGRAFGAGASRETAANVEPGRRNEARIPSQVFLDDEKRELKLLSVGTPRLVEHLLAFGKPSIAAINGVFVGGYTSLVGACDIRIASDRAMYRVAFLRDGLACPDVGATYWLTRLIGRSHLLELAYTNDLIDAKEMERIGLANHVVPHDELIPYCKNMIRRMRQISPLFLNTCKKVVNKVVDARDLMEAQQWERWGSNAIRGTHDREEARRSWLEKRDPVYKGQ